MVSLWTNTNTGMELNKHLIGLSGLVYEGLSTRDLNFICVVISGCQSTCSHGVKLKLAA